MTERNIVNSTGLLLFSGLIEYLYPMKWFALLAFIIIVADLRFGTLAAKKRGETVRFSRAIKRTGNKIVDYTCWLLLAWALGLAFGDYLESQFLPAIVLAVIFGIELESCFSNYFETKGMKVKINLLALLQKNAHIINITKKRK